MAVTDKYDILCHVVRIAGSGNLSPHARLKSLAKFLTETFHLASTSIYILDEERRYLTEIISSFGPEPRLECHIPLGVGGAGLCADGKAPLDGNKADFPLHPDELLRGDEERLLIFPVMDSRTLLGVVSYGVGAGDGLAEDGKQFLQELLAAIAGLIRLLGIAQRSNRRIRKLTVIGELGAVVNKSLPPDKLASLILKTCHNLTNSSCTILRVLGADGLSPGVRKKCVQSSRVSLPFLLDMEKECSQRVLETGTPLLVSDIIADEELPPSYICVPLRFETKMLGALTVFGKRRSAGSFRNFDEEDRELFASMAAIISNALEGAVNYQRMLSLATENDKKLKELSLLYRISNTMLSTINLNKLIHLTLTALTAGTNPCFQRAMLFLINERTGVMQGMLGVTRETAAGVFPSMEIIEDILLSRWDITDEEMWRQRDSDFSREVRSTRLPLNVGLNVCSRAVLEKKLICVNDVEREMTIDRDFVRKFDVTSFAAAPLIAKNKVVGVIVVDNPLNGKRITPDDLRYLQLFTNQAGMAIENSMLYNRIEDTDRHLREARERIVQGEKLAALGEMAANIAHELKSPLVSIGGFGKRLEKKLSKGSAEWKYADIIVREVDRLEKMLTDILIFSKKSTICYSQCDMNGIVQDALAIVEGFLEDKGIMVRLALFNAPILLSGDCQQLKQVFINLFSNAGEAMGPGGELEVFVAPVKLSERDAVSVRVSDNGGGVPLEMLNKIFDPFFTSKESGTGLGLAIAQAIAANHGGHIRLNNKEGIGAEFTVTLPLHP